MPPPPPAHDALPAGLVGVPTLYRPARVVEVDVSSPLPPLTAAEAGRPDSVLVVVRVCGGVVGMVLADTPLEPQALAAAIEQELGASLRTALEPHIGVAPTLTAAGFAHDKCPVVDARRALAASGPGVSVVVCTRNRSELLRRCLNSLAAVNYHNFQVVVVDNAPVDEATKDVCEAFASVVNLKYVRELVPGLSRARNCGLANACHDFVAFIDDDERVDSDWLVHVVREFLADPTVGAVSGLILPAELETTAQVQFEQYGGHSKGRGFQRAVFDRPYLAERQSPMYPLPPFGAGGNMAFRARALDTVGNFDVAMGAGTRTGGGEDTAAFSEVMLAGWTVIYAPDALVWHYHLRDDHHLREHLNGYAVGLGAYYTALLWKDGRRLADLLRLALPAILELLTRPRADASVGAVAPAPDALELASRPIVKLFKIATGPYAYVMARRDARRLRVSPGPASARGI